MNRFDHRDSWRRGEVMKRLQLLVALAILIVPSQLVVADTVVAPGSLASAEGSLSNFYPFGVDSITPLNQGTLAS
jgi:hypothetical protein